MVHLYNLYLIAMPTGWLTVGCILNIIMHYPIGSQIYTLRKFEQDVNQLVTFYTEAMYQAGHDN